MRYGSSGNLTATQPNKTGIETIEKLKKFGYDYIELPWRHPESKVRS